MASLQLLSISFLLDAWLNLVVENLVKNRCNTSNECNKLSITANSRLSIMPHTLIELVVEFRFGVWVELVANFIPGVEHTGDLLDYYIFSAAPAAGLLDLDWPACVPVAFGSSEPDGKENIFIKDEIA